MAPVGVGTKVLAALARCSYALRFAERILDPLEAPVTRDAPISVGGFC
jgi:hypothetical protein